MRCEPAIVSTAEAIEERVVAARRSAGYRNYRVVRDEVLAMRDRESREGLAKPSAYWTEELENIDYLLDAPPLVAASLRRHCFHITGIRAYEYRAERDKARNRLTKRRSRLIALASKQLVLPEPKILGAFGFEIKGGLYNTDSLKFSEGLIALKQAGILAELDNREHPVIWEIGAGWGGFAWHLKQVLPAATVVISDFPELFLFSATYLRTAFPDARCVFEGSPVDPGPGSWGDYDFVFASNARLAETTPDGLDLVVNMVSFQEMTSAQVREYSRQARALGAPWLYSLNRERSPYNPELAGVSEILAEHWRLERLELLPGSYTRATARERAGGLRRAPAWLRGRGKATQQKGLDYQHLVGTPR